MAFEIEEYHTMLDCKITRKTKKAQNILEV